MSHVVLCVRIAYTTLVVPSTTSPTTERKSTSRVSPSSTTASFVHILPSPSAGASVVPPLVTVIALNVSTAFISCRTCSYALYRCFSIFFTYIILLALYFASDRRVNLVVRKIQVPHYGCNVGQGLGQRS